MLLELRHADGRYGQIQAVRDISLRIETGASIALLGRNGAGKTTVLRLLAGSLPLAAGEVSWDGEEVSALPAEERVRRGIVLVPEGRGVFPALTVEENLVSGAYPHRPKQAELKTLRDGVYDIFPRLRDLRNRRGGSLSGGEQQMVAIGRALMSKPKILLLDEPSLGLAPMVVDTVYEALRKIRDDGVGVVVVEQHVGLALDLCEDVIGLDNGRIIVSGSAAEVRESQALQSMYMASEVVAAATRPEIPAAAVGHLERLVDTVDETGVIALYSAERRMMMFHTVVQSSRPLSYNVDRDKWVPVTLGASGLAMVAFMPPEERDALLAEAKVEDPEAMAETLRQIKDEGYAASHGQRIRGAVGLAAPILVDGAVVGDVALTIPEDRFDPARQVELVRHLLDCTRAVSADWAGVAVGAQR